ncbi:MAG TPA: hypothetical protein VND90_09870 [Terracidiphilus sp.]|nr:hypothetical protein [Terracidiphilus sp.]
MRIGLGIGLATLGMAAMAAAAPAAKTAAKTVVRHRTHTVYLGPVKQVPYSKEGDPAGAEPGETALETRTLVVDGQVKEWTTGDVHDVTERSFVVRRALRLNDSLPSDTKMTWVWQRGPWLLVDRETGRVTALKLPDYNPAVSRVVWYRDYGAYCGVTPSGKILYAVVAQLTVRRAVLRKKLEELDPANPPQTACGAAEWQRDPMRVTFYPGGHPAGHAAGNGAVSFDIVAGSAVLVESDSDVTETPEQPQKPEPAQKPQ